MVKNIVTDYDFYNDRADEVEFKEDISYIIADLKDTLLKFKDKNLIALTASQIGYKKRIVAMVFENNDVRFFINPSISNTRGTMGFDIETCHSISDRNAKFAVLRYPEIHLSYLDENFKLAEHPMCMIGMSAMHMQKAIDILDGRLICDGSLPILEGWEKLKPHEQDEIFEEWLKNQKEITEKIKEDIEKDKELKDLSDAIDFMQSVAKGETQLMTDEELSNLK